LANQNQITSSSSIFNNVVCQNQEPIFEKKDIALHDFMLAVFYHFELKYPKFHKMDNLSKLGWLASEVLLKYSQFDATAYTPTEVGIVIANASSSLDTDINYFETTKSIASPALFVYTLPNIVIGEICIRNGFKGENAFFVSEEFDTELIQSYVNNLMNNGQLKACICGWVELIKEEYKAVLYLVEQKQTEKSIAFTVENMNEIWSNSLKN